MKKTVKHYGVESTTYTFNKDDIQSALVKHFGIPYSRNTTLYVWGESDHGNKTEPAFVELVVKIRGDD